MKLVSMITTVMAVIITVSYAMLTGCESNRKDTPATALQENVRSLMNLSYTIDGEVFRLKDGRAEKEYEPGSASKNTLTIYGDPVFGDLDNDGDSDAAILLANDPGGSGTFYYAALSIFDGNLYHSTNAVFLGDRITPKSITITDGFAVFLFMERPADGAMADPPSAEKSVWIRYDEKSGQIREWDR